MFIFKGFATYASLCVNTPGINNAIGELSSRSMTYTKEKGYYRKPSISPEIGLVSFITKRNDQLIELDVDTRDHILTIVKACYDTTITRPTVEIDHADHINPLIAQFAPEAYDFRAGPIISDGTYFMPEWLRWKMRDSNEEREIHIWFGDSAFQNQFPESEIVIAAPFDNLDDFFLAGNVVEQRLNDIDIVEKTKRLHDAMGEYPATFFRYENFDYHDRFNSSRVVPSSWGVVIYGVSGNNVDAIKDALVEYILSNSSHSREEWAEILPDIFRRNEFIFAPYWQKYAIPNQVTERGIHSPFISIDEALETLEYAASDYSPAHIRNNAIISGYPYRSLTMLSIGHIENRESKYRINDLFPDWINVPTSQDYNRMSERTKQWSQLLFSLVHEAEEFEEYSDIPQGMMKVLRDGKLYLSATFENVNYLVLCKTSSLQ